MLRIVVSLGLAWVLALPATAQEAMRLRMTELMLSTDFDRHILPRFRFKHRISLTPVGPAEEADLALSLEGGGGARVFATAEGETVWLVALSQTPEVEAVLGTFQNWLTSTPGKAAIDGFAPDGAAPFTSEIAVAAPVVTAKVVEGNVQLGSELAIRHCGRCHVVDKRNRMGGIGSTPSFAALRGRSNWSDLFLAYWAENPHPSFTQVEGMTEPFTPDRPTHVQPVELTMRDVEAITAFVGTLEALDLGAPIQSQ